MENLDLDELLKPDGSRDCPKYLLSCTRAVYELKVNDLLLILTKFNQKLCDRILFYELPLCIMIEISYR